MCSPGSRTNDALMSTATPALNDVNLAAVVALATHIQRSPEAAQTT